MTNLQEFKDLVNNIIIDFNGVITNSDAPLFSLKKGEKIQDFHPLFLQCLEELDTAIDASIVYPGVFMEHATKPHYCDVRLKKEPHFIAITLFNYTTKYQTKQQEAQQNNELEIIKSIAASKNHNSFINN